MVRFGFEKAVPRLVRAPLVPISRWPLTSVRLEKAVPRLVRSLLLTMDG